jgi:hypothetical protein
MDRRAQRFFATGDDDDKAAAIEAALEYRAVIGDLEDIALIVSNVRDPGRPSDPCRVSGAAAVRAAAPVDRALPGSHAMD